MTMSTKTQRTSNLLLELACYISLAISVIPVVDYYSPWFITAIPVLLVLYITLQRKSNLFPSIMFMAAFVLLGLLQYIFLYRSVGFVSHIINFVIAFLPCLIAYQTRSTYDKPAFYKRYVQILAIFTGITSITTIIGLEKYPMAARELASGTAIYDTAHYRAENIGGYEYIYALVILIPILLYLIKNTKKLLRIINIAILVINLVCIYESQYTTALLLTIVAFLLILAFKNKVFFAVSLFALLLFWILGGTNLLSRMLLFFSERIELEYVSDRLLQLSQLVGGSEINTETSTERIDHYKNQLTLFAKSPLIGHNLFGYNEEHVSGHTYIFDWLSSIGVLGFGAVAFIFRKLYTKVVRISRKKTCATVKLTWLMLVILACLNPVIFPLITTIAFTACSFLQGHHEHLETQKFALEEPSV